MGRLCNALLVLLCLHCLMAVATSAWPHRHAMQSSFAQCIACNVLKEV